MTQRASRLSHELSPPGVVQTGKSIWTLLRPYAAAISTIIGLLSALFIIGVTSGATQRTLEQMQNKMQKIDERLDTIERQTTKIDLLQDMLLLLHRAALDKNHD
jgi:membrane protein insertase Oxa1/YidC/SpoIIIJ